MPEIDPTAVVPFPTGPTASNREFLELIFGERWREALVTSFKRDPADPNAPRQDWNASPAGDVLANKSFDQGNTYFCPSLLTPGIRDRRLEHWTSLHAVVIDDIGTKVKILDVIDLLRSRPTYIIETSPGNYQAGWKIEPETRLAWVKGMLAQLDKALDGKADNLTNPIAWRRLPVGYNTKAALISPDRPRGWEVRLSRRGYPGPMIRGLDWPCEIEARIGDIIPMTTLDRGVGDGQRPDAAVLAQDPVYRALEAAGHILGEKLTSDKFWAATVRCPWIAGHGPDRPLTGAEYVPAVEGHRGWFHCFHCERRGQAEFREQLDTVLRQEGAKIVAAFEFDAVDPKRVAHASLGLGGATDLWSAKPLPVWPGGILPPVLEDSLADLAANDGLDLGALGAAMLTAASGAIDKRSRLTPYTGSQWAVPPVLWLMLIAAPGMRKTAILHYVTGRMKQLHNERMRRYAGDMGGWKLQPAAVRQQQPEPKVQALLAADVTVEKLQEWMAANSRGLLYLRDELAGLFEFGRYQAGGTGAGARASFLEFYEGGPTTIGRMTRTTTIDNCALSMIGGIQPHRLAEFKGLTDDGLLPRFGTLSMQQGKASAKQPVDSRPIDATIEALLTRGSSFYGTDAAGEALIRDTEKLGLDLAQRPDVSAGYGGFLAKLHGTHARAALILHMIDGGQAPIVPPDTVGRARRYALFMLEHADSFYAGLAGSGDSNARAIGSYILRHPAARITAGQLRSSVACCRSLKSLKEIQDALFLLVIGGWLKPETNYTNNSAWWVNPGLEAQFAERKMLEASRVELVKAAMNRQGLYR